MKNAPRVFVYGTASFTRGSIPQTLADFEWLPKVDLNALPQAALPEYTANLEAYELFVRRPDVSLREIEARTGVHPIAATTLPRAPAFSAARVAESIAVSPHPAAYGFTVAGYPASALALASFCAVVLLSSKVTTARRFS